MLACWSYFMWLVQNEILIPVSRIQIPAPRVSIILCGAGSHSAV